MEGYGTGFIIRPNGIIVTNQHVVANAERVVVTLPDGSDLPAKVLGEDPLTDIAVLRVDRQRAARPSPPGRSTDLMIGEWVVALGNPYAYMLGNAEPTVTVGVVSATGRNILPSGDQTGLYFDMIQTDAAINPGNSGGPLTNALGEVVGVNSSIFSNSGGSVGLGFAIPIERALAGGRRDHQERHGASRLGRARGRGRRRPCGTGRAPGGVTVASVAPGGPAAQGRVCDRATSWSRPTAAGSATISTGRRSSSTSTSATRSTCRVRSGRDSASRRIVTGDLPTVTAEKITVLEDLAADQRDARDPGRARHPERAGRPDLPDLAAGEPARPGCRKAT